MERRTKKMTEKALGKMTIHELAEKIAALPEGGTCDFCLGKDCASHKAVKQTHFGGDIVVIEKFGSGVPYIIDLAERGRRSHEYHVFRGLQLYAKYSEVDELFVLRENTPLDKSKLYGRETLLEILEENGANEPAIAAIGDHYMKTIGEYPIWRYPLCDAKYLGAFIVPVQEGWLYIPYDYVDKEEYELLVLDDTNLLDAETCEYLAKETKEYCDGFVAALRRIQAELKTNEEAEKNV